MSHGSNYESMTSEPPSWQSQKSAELKLSDRKFKVLLGRICGITDPRLKQEIFELTFEVIQLGAWSDGEWQLFVDRLFRRHPETAESMASWRRDLVARGLTFSEIVRAIMNRWLTWRGIESADMREIYAAFECSGKLEIAHNAAVNVVLALRQRQGRATSDCVDPFSEAEETPTTSFEESMHSGSDQPRIGAAMGGAEDADRSGSTSGYDPDRSLAERQSVRNSLGVAGATAEGVRPTRLTAKISNHVRANMNLANRLSSQQNTHSRQNDIVRYSSPRPRHQSFHNTLDPAPVMGKCGEKPTVSSL